ncbi:MAG: hypothetical protein HFI62_12940 [Lachnospiraceae bacterium]|jgi:hypothetical protein|nr:hypothetical protein [Lachnospiraceae bacterium]
MADIWAKRKDVDKICKKAEKKYPKGMVLDIYIQGSNDEHVIYCVSKGVEHYVQKKLEKAGKKAPKKKNAVSGI